MTARVWGALAGAAMVLLGVFLPRDWYETLPMHPELATPPITGVTLLQVCLVFDGLVLLGFVVAGWAYRPIAEPERLAPQFRGPVEDSRAGRSWPWALLLIVALGLALRLYRVGSDLWLDEITTVLDYENMSAFHVATTYIGSNNHLLNTLLIKLSMSLFGREEWAIRLPAVLFGTATIPLLYGLSRLALSRWSSLGAAMLLAVSYHHIFFSQNARGYVSYVFFSLLATWLFILALQRDRLQTWILYVGAMSLNFAAHLNSAFVFAGHVALGGIALLEIHRRGQSPLPLFRRLLPVFAVTGLFGLNLYATILPQVYVYVEKVYTTQSSGYATFSIENFVELLREISAGFGTGVMLSAVPFLAIVALGFFALLRRNWILALGLLLPNALMVLFLVGRGLSFSPRFFLLALPFAILLAVTAVSEVADRLAARGSQTRRLAKGGAAVLVAVLALLSLASLRNYYAAPKQDFRGAIAHLQQIREPDDRIVVIYLAEWGFRYYAEEFGLREDQEFSYVRSLERFDEVVRATAPGRSLLVSTLHRPLRIRYPELLERMMRDWEVVEEFRGTLGGGTLAIWEPRSASPSERSAAE